MTWLSSRMRIFVGLDPVDMRKSFDGLAAEVRRQLARDPLAGHLYVFVNRPRTHAKMLLFERAGYWIFYRRLERGTFQLPAARDASRGVEIDPAALALILEGIDLRTAKRRLRYERPTGAPASW